MLASDYIEFDDFIFTYPPVFFGELSLYETYLLLNKPDSSFLIFLSPEIWQDSQILLLLWYTLSSYFNRLFEIVICIFSYRILLLLSYKSYM